MDIRRRTWLGPRATRILAATLVGLLGAVILATTTSGAWVRDRIAPAAPSRIVVDGATKSSVQLRWTTAHDNVEVVGYSVYLGTSRVAVTPDPHATVPGLVCGTSYAVAVLAFDAAGNRSKWATAVVATSECTDTDAPTAPSGIRQLVSTESTVTIEWNRSSDNVLVAGYRVFLGPLADGATQLTSFTFARLTCGSTYEVAVEAYDVSGNTSARSRFFVATHECRQALPATPWGLRFVDATETSVRVAWNASTEVVGYDVALDGSRVGSTSSTSYRVGNLACGRAHQVAVVAMDADGSRSLPASVVASTNACAQPTPTDTQRPSTPSGVSVASTTQTSVQLAWQPSADNVGVAGYGVYRGGALAAATAATTHTFESLSCGTSYQVGVDAFDAAGNRSSAAQVVAATSACAVDSVAPSKPGSVFQLSRTETSITIGWAASTDNVGIAGYRLFRGGAPVATTSQTLYTYSDLACGSSYTLGVHAYDGAGNHSPQAVVIMTTAACPDVTPSPAPAGLSTSSVTQTSATLAWAASPGAAGYGLYIDGASAGQTTSTSYGFGTLACGKTYTLAVDAYDAAGNRSAKSSASVTTSTCTDPPPPPLPVGGLAVSAAGSDSTCIRGDASKPCRTFQRAYDLAQPGDTVLVQPGTYPPNDAARQAVTVIGSAKATAEPVTFTCAGGTVDVAAVWFVIKAFHVRLSGSCFLLHGLRIGEGDDTGVTTNDVTVEGVKMEGVEVVGAQQVVLRNVEIGPAVYCHAQGKTGYGINGGLITSAMWCDPAGPRYEAFYANRGNGDLRFESFFHNNSGGVNPTLLVERTYVHDIQTKDAVNMHTACALIWTVPGAPSNSLVFRGNRFENCAVQGIQVEKGDGMTFENNMFGYPTEPLSNGRGDDVEAPQAQRELNLKTGDGWTPRNYLIRFNSFSHGISIDQSQANPSYENFKVIGNILGSYSYCKGRGDVFDQNVFVGPACGANAVSIPSFPYVQYNAPIDYHLASAGPYVDLVSSDNGSDYILENDYDGEARPKGGRRDAGADEKQ